MTKPIRILLQTTIPFAEDFVDYNWDTEMGCPSFLSEPPGDGYKRNPQALEDIKMYVRNAAVLLAAK